MTVEKLIDELKKLDGSKEILLARDPEINGARDVLWVQEFDYKTYIILPDETKDYAW